MKGESNKLKFVVLAAFLFAALSHWFVVPIFEIYDEGAHVGYVRFLRIHHRLPVYDPNVSWEKQPYGQEAAQPPLYYAVEALLSAPFSMNDFLKDWQINPHAKVGIPKATDNHNLFIHDPAYQRFPWHGTALAVHVMRLFSVILALWTLLLVYKLGIELTGLKEIGLMSMSFIAFNPTFTHLAAGVDNDWMVIPLATLAILKMVKRVNSSKPTLESTFWLSILSVLAILSKISGLLFLPLLMLMLCWELATHRIGLKDFIEHVALLMGVVVVLSGWWFARNYRIYGDPTATIVHVWRWGQPSHRSLRQVILHESEGVWIYFWGVFGLGTLILPDPALGWIAFVSALSVAGLVFYVNGNSTRIESFFSKRGFAWTLVVLWGCIVSAGLLRWTPD